MSLLFNLFPITKKRSHFPVPSQPENRPGMRLRPDPLSAILGTEIEQKDRRGYKLIIWPLKANASDWKINQKDWILHRSHLDGHLWRFCMPAFVGRVTVPHLKVQDSDAITAIQNLCVTHNLLPLTLFTVYPTYRTVKAQNRGACTLHFSYSPESFMYPTLAGVQKKVESELFRVACIPAPRFLNRRVNTTGIKYNVYLTLYCKN